MPTPTSDSYPGVLGSPIYGGMIEPVVWQTAPNELRVSLPSGSQANYPLQFGRAFGQGSITGLPEVSIGGTPVVAQQADVKTRYSDGSVKFAVISVILPTLTTSVQTLTIANKVVGSAPVAETIANMLANYNFNATINVSVSGTPVAGAPVSARTLLAALTDSGLAAETAAAGVNSRYWTVGPVCTTVILCDHTAKTADIGTNATKAIRPMFHVQFWPTIGKYHVRHIIENADVTKLKDEVGIDVAFTVDNSSPVTKHSQTGVYLYAGTFKSRAYWGGTDVPRANVDHSLPYLSSIGVMPNYDPTIVMNASALASYASDWATKTRNLGDSGYWQKAMSSTGGRPDLGVVPKWEIVTLYSGVAHMHEITEAHAEFTGNWAFFFREGNAAKTIYGATSGVGRIISKLSRPTQFMYDGNNYMVTSGSDGFTADGTLSVTRDGWQHDHAHTPGVFWTSYLTTGSAFWYEKLMQLGAWSQFLTNPATGYSSLSNGVASTDLIINGVQSRGWGWQYRNRARAWWASFDNSPERSLMYKALIDAAAQRAGLFDVPGMMVGNTIRDAWNTNYATWYSATGTTGRPNALHYFDPKGGYTQGQFEGVFGVGNYPDDWGVGAQAGWMRNFITLCIYHAVELGVSEAMPLAAWIAHQSIAIANSTEPRHIADYIIPDVKADNSYYQTLDDLYDGWAHNADGAYPSGMVADSNSGFSGAGAPNTYTVSVEGYGSIAAASIAMSNAAPGQASAWSVVAPWHTHTVYYHHDPRYAIIPR